MNKDQSKIPQATAKRLPLYYRFLKNLHASGKQRVSSAELSDAVKSIRPRSAGIFPISGRSAKKDTAIMWITCCHFSEKHWIRMKRRTSF